MRSFPFYTIEVMLIIFLHTWMSITDHWIIWFDTQIVFNRYKQFFFVIKNHPLFKSVFLRSKWFRSKLCLCMILNPTFGIKMNVNVIATNACICSPCNRYSKSGPYEWLIKCLKNVTKLVFQYTQTIFI